MTSRTRIPRAELTGICGAVVKRMSRRMLGDVAEPVEVTWHNRTTPDVADDVELAENVSIAMLTVLETLGPVERAVFVLHEVFEMPYAEIAEAVGRTPASVRQIARRAREHVGARRPRMQVDRAQQQAVVEKFLAAVSTGDVQALVDVLAPDVVVVADGGAQAHRRRPPGGGLPVQGGIAAGFRDDHDLAQRDARHPNRRRRRGHRGERGRRGRPHHPRLRDPEPAQAGVAGQRVGSAAVTERGDVRFRRTASGKRFRDLRR